MVLYRISNCTYAKDVSGTGAKLFGGRWNSIGTPIHYMTSSRALAALEVLVNKGSMRDSKNLCLTVFEVPDDSTIAIDIVDLPLNWKKYPSLPEIKQVGDDFVKSGSFLLLKVPSVVIDDEYNFLMNVAHPLASEIKLLEVKPFSFDERLV